MKGSRWEMASSVLLTYVTEHALDVQASTSKGIVGLEATVGAHVQQNSKTSTRLGRAQVLSASRLTGDWSRFFHCATYRLDWLAAPKMKPM